MRSLFLWCEALGLESGKPGDRYNGCEVRYRAVLLAPSGTGAASLSGGAVSFF